MKKIIKVDGIHCAGCEGRLKRTLEALPEVEEVVASHSVITNVPGKEGHNVQHRTK